MYKFTLNKINEIEGKIDFYKLVIDGKCEFDEFWSDCLKQGSLESELNTIQARMQLISDLKTMPQEKHKDITPAKESVKEYEIKTKHLRVYMFHDKKNGRIVVCAGKKTTQKRDINHFRNVKKQYLRQYEN